MRLSGFQPLAEHENRGAALRWSRLFRHRRRRAHRPMNKNAQDIMMGAPSEVTQKQLDELSIAVTAHEEE